MVAWLTFITILLIFFINIIFYFLSYKMICDSENLSSYECGLDLSCQTRMIFSYRFFLISLLFLIFDVEIVLMLPLPYLLLMKEGIYIFFLFLLMLLCGLVYEYYLGSLNWL